MRGKIKLEMYFQSTLASAAENNELLETHSFIGLRPAAAQHRHISRPVFALWWETSVKERVWRLSFAKLLIWVTADFKLNLERMLICARHNDIIANTIWKKNHYFFPPCCDILPIRLRQHRKVCTRWNLELEMIACVCGPDTRSESYHKRSGVINRVFFSNPHSSL